MTGTRVGDGLALGDQLDVVAERAVAAALRPLDGVRPDLACVFVSGGEPDQVTAALERAAEQLDAHTVLGCTAHGVMAAGKGVEGVGGVSVWAAALPGVSLRGFHLEVIRTSDSVAVLGMPDRRDDDVVGLLLADPWSFPSDGFVDNSATALGGLPLVGGLASGATGAGQTRLLCDGKVFDRGAVGVVVGGRAEVHTLVSQGCRPIGRPLTVTAATGSTVTQLGGQPALVRAQEAVASLPPDEHPLAVRGLQLGVAMDEYTDEHGPGDFLVRAIAAADQTTGALEVADTVPVGTTVQFLLRDADTAHDDLAEVLAAFRARVGLTGMAGALVFSCNGRGRSMFPSADHDVRAVRGGLGIESVAGFFAAGEFGPVGGRNHLHGFTATVLAFES
ncbi:MAG TPA: FIST N-terminal domain-containing protein [Candidatus Nanopelagicales bacterium]|nr:FIST N-terminal domain-containing protein [Candidatus Nanopelagicales bacterium]